MAAIAVHNIPEGIAIAMPAASQDIDIECIERLHEQHVVALANGKYDNTSQYQLNTSR